MDTYTLSCRRGVSPIWPIAGHLDKEALKWGRGVKVADIVEMQVAADLGSTALATDQGIAEGG